MPVPKTAPTNLPPIKHTRAEMARLAGREIELPDIDAPLMSIITLTFDIGPYAGAGEAPVSWVDIDAWSRITGVCLSPWQARAVRRLASEYLASQRRSSDEDAPKPWHSDQDKARRARVAKNIRSVLRGN